MNILPTDEYTNEQDKHYQTYTFIKTRIIRHIHSSRQALSDTYIHQDKHSHIFVKTNIIRHISQTKYSIITTYSEGSQFSKASA